jgi:soluble lytic murein transglycosylase-like protein
MSFSDTIARRGLPSPWDAEIAAQTDDAAQAALVKAVIATESAWMPGAVNPSDPSYGLMQILCGPRGPAPGITCEELLDPSTNLRVGIGFLRGLLTRYGSTSDALSAYNAGRPLRVASGGWSNQRYVDEVQTYWTWYLNRMEAVDANDPDPGPDAVTVAVAASGFGVAVLVGVGLLLAAGARRA